LGKEQLRYYSWSLWPYWNTHVKRDDPPYYVWEKSHYEFVAYGGARK